MKKTLLFILVILFITVNSTIATTRYVPSGGSPSYSTIQAAINACSMSGDTVIVANGTFTGDGNENIDFNGKTITVRSANGPQNCIIDLPGVSYEDFRGFEVSHDGTLDGFTIKDGRGIAPGIWTTGGSPIIINCVIQDCETDWGGGGILCEGPGSPTITNCTLINNHADAAGGGIYISQGSSPIITNCLIMNNTSGSGGIAYGGGGIYCEASTPQISNCIIIGNNGERGGGIFFWQCSASTVISNCIISKNISDSSTYGDGIHCRESSPTIRNCTVAYNSGMGVLCQTNSSPVISNCIVWGNGDDLSNAWATYSCVEDGDSGTGNISNNPLFTDSGSDDYHLKSMGGRWNGSTWVIDAVSSPCIDAGNLGSDYSLEPSPNGGRINMGAYGNTSEASKSGYFLTLTLPNPNGGEILYADYTYDVNWSSNLSVGTILIEYSINNGANWSPVDPPNIGNTGTYSWQVPEVSSDECLIRVSDEADPGVNDVSDSVFTIKIPTLSVINPNGGEVVLKEIPYEIQWSSNYSCINVLIEYSTNNGQNWIPVDPPNIGNTGSCTWPVPEVISDECLVRITDGDDPGINDTSDNVFEIGGCALKGDLNGDCHVDLFDLCILSGEWMYSESVRIYDFNFDNNPNWTTEGEWQFGQPTGGGGTYGNPDPNKGYIGSNVYGVNLNGDYDTAVGGPYCLTAGPFSCTQYENIKLKFSRWLNSDVPDYVSCKVEVSNNGSDWTTVWEHSGTSDITDDSWQLEEYDISSIADREDSVYICWSYEILDGRAYPYSGWNIDDIQLWGTR